MCTCELGTTVGIVGILMGKRGVTVIINLMIALCIIRPS